VTADVNAQRDCLFMNYATEDAAFTALTFKLAGEDYKIRCDRVQRGRSLFSLSCRERTAGRRAGLRSDYRLGFSWCCELEDVSATSAVDQRPTRDQLKVARPHRLNLDCAAVLREFVTLRALWVG